MRIVIPTRKRIGRQYTLGFLPKTMRPNIDLVCPENEVERHRALHSVNVIAQPDADWTIAKKRAWIMQTWPHEKILMLDDDLKFYKKRPDDPTRMLNATDDDITYWFGELEKKLTPETPHGGFGPRMMNDKHPPGWQEGGRMMFALGYHLPTIRENVEFGRIETREDMDYVLQLLRKGLPNLICQTFTCGQETGKYGAEGGCSGQRTTEASNDDAKRLAELHPGYVSVVSREYKISVPRLEVVCKWKRALGDGKKWREAQASGA